jgi:MFS family permease
MTLRIKPFKRSGLWLHRDFLRLWSGQTISVFGSMIGGTAMTFTAILFLEATPFQMGLLGAMQIVPAFLTGLFAGAWIDRLPRRPVLVGADIGRALVLGSIPLAAALGVLSIVQVYIVALLVSILEIFFHLAYQSYLPGLVGKDHLVEGNSKLAASAAVAEFGGFSIGGWLVQIFTAPLAVLIDAGSFLLSAVAVGSIRAPEAAAPIESAPGMAAPNMRGEIVEGIHTVWRHPLLRASALVTLFESLAGGVYGSVVVLFMSRELGFDPGLLGMTWAVGGLSALAGAALVQRANRRLGVGNVMFIGLLVPVFTSGSILLAKGPTLFSLIILIALQLGDGFNVAYEINNISFRQGITEERMLGRVNATIRFLTLGAALAGALAGGALGGSLGLRLTLAAGISFSGLAAITLGLSPLRKIKDS